MSHRARSLEFRSFEVSYMRIGLSWLPSRASPNRVCGARTENQVLECGILTFQVAQDRLGQTPSVGRAKDHSPDAHFACTSTEAFWKPIPTCSPRQLWHCAAAADAWEVRNPVECVRRPLQRSPRSRPGTGPRSAPGHPWAPVRTPAPAPRSGSVGSPTACPAPVWPQGGA